MFRQIKPTCFWKQKRDDDVISHVAMSVKHLYFACILLISKAKSAKLLQHVL